MGLLITFVPFFATDFLAADSERSEVWLGFDEWNTMQSTGTFTPDAVRYL